MIIKQFNQNARSHSVIFTLTSSSSSVYYSNIYVSTRSCAICTSLLSAQRARVSPAVIITFFSLLFFSIPLRFFLFFFLFNRRRHGREVPSHFIRFLCTAPARSCNRNKSGPNVQPTNYYRFPFIKVTSFFLLYTRVYTHTVACGAWRILISLEVFAIGMYTTSRW